MSKQVCEAINEIDKNVVFDSKSQEYTLKDQIYGVYCSPSRKGEKGQCDSGGKLLGSAFIALLKMFDNAEDYEEILKNDRLSEYAILWLNYKLNQYKTTYIRVYSIYDMLTRNKWFGKHYHSLKEKTGVMKIYFSYLNGLYALLKGICNTITKCNEDPSNTSECLKQAQNSVKIYQYLSKNCPWYKDCILYCNILSHLKNDYDKFREKYKTHNLPELKLPDGEQSCECLCKSKEQKFNAKKTESENSKMDTSPTNSLSGQSSDILIGTQEVPLPGEEGHRNESDSIPYKPVNSANKLKGKKGGPPVILGFQRKLRNKLQGLEGGSNGQYDVSVDKSSAFETVGEISPKIKGLGGYVKKIIGGKQRLKGEEGESLGMSGAQPGLRYSLPGLDGEFYGPYRGLSGQTHKLAGLNGEYLGTSGAQTNLVDGSNGQHDILIGQSSEFKGDDESLDIKYGFPHFKIESKNSSTTIEDNVNPHLDIPSLIVDAPLGYPNHAHSNSVSSSDSNSGSNLGNNIIYIVVPFVVILVILGISYKWVEIRRKNMLKKAQSIKRVINLCDEKNNENEVINTFIKNKKRPNYKLGL
ncbi:Plasmodium variant antigen protein Cir/Yir/Bir, putative [Plasmodium chabaudi adami]|uniref:Plasmodium variant antigen protein Cir/Yir/Bir, putative n=1 Tax=Plasmodium chabaudi adami TaxID=5826 RepID=A0A1D3L9M1_PLACE|nr:Plasmodium variant antigen protein Cir/Yir/Bir, putative [Plasmodium chabaudi adami]